MFRIFVSAAETSALLAGVLIGLVFTGVGRGAPSPTCTVQVVAGQSIQTAIDGAATGATVCVGPGIYHENLLIAKDGITLKGAGPEKTILEPPDQPAKVCLNIEVEPSTSSMTAWARATTSFLTGVKHRRPSGCADEREESQGCVCKFQQSGIGSAGTPC